MTVSPRAPPVMLPSTMTMRAPRSLAERCYLKKKLKRVNRITLQCSQQQKATAPGHNLKLVFFNYLSRAQTEQITCICTA